MQLHEQRIAAALDADALHRPLHATENRLRREHAPRAVARGACLGHALKMTLADALARHLDEAEVGYRERLGAGAVAAEVLTQLLEHTVAIGPRVHVDQIGDDHAAYVTETQFTRDFSRCLQIRAQARLLRVLLAHEPSGVDVDGDERLGRLGCEVASPRPNPAALAAHVTLPPALPPV